MAIGLGPSGKKKNPYPTSHKSPCGSSPSLGNKRVVGPRFKREATGKKRKGTFKHVLTV